MSQHTVNHNKLIETFVSLTHFAHSSSVGQVPLLIGYKGFAHCKNLNELNDGELSQHNTDS